ncbi:uncharacterized protein N7498_004453 [Penicillium cinerascens]|uniref:Uncharacterized protein n=1 Tax=Penicillium cinerascens TaxID=70096 RepID=A0A9W9T7V5_9EURO|nr:uncharacterized protein N7498_004453 [Penicillium cinerascens]KAJ5212807.1 hypothetical protein N7498_004453 [Penicillium cinerascens]
MALMVYACPIGAVIPHRSQPLRTMWVLRVVFISGVGRGFAEGSGRTVPCRRTLGSMEDRGLDPHANASEQSKPVELLHSLDLPHIFSRHTRSLSGNEDLDAGRFKNDTQTIPRPNHSPQVAIQVVGGPLITVVISTQRGWELQSGDLSSRHDRDHVGQLSSIVYAP